MALLTVLEKINIGAVSEAYSVIDILRSGLYGGGVDLQLPRKIYCIRKSIQWAYDADPTDESLISTTTELIRLCGKYYLQANAALNGGGVIPTPITPTENIYPFIITSENFASDGVSYDNSEIVGDTLSLFVNEYSQQWLVEGDTTFSYTSTGIIMNIPGFDANSQEWTIMVQKLNS